MIQTVRAELLGDATRYIWWQEPEQALRHPLRIVAQVARALLMLLTMPPSPSSRCPWPNA